jgi:DNA-binding Lrp family transcriptional regulator
MSRGTSPDSWLRFPMDELLGSSAGIRLLRVLVHDMTEPLSAPEAARRTGLTVPGARKALERLVATGFVKRVGAGRSQQYALHSGDHLTVILQELFAEEHGRYDELIEGLRTLFGGVSEVWLAWIDRMPKKPGQPLELAVIASAQSIPWIRDELRGRLTGLESRFDQVIEFTTYTRADAPHPDWDCVQVLAGVPESASSQQSAATGSHAEMDARALRVSAAVALLLRRDPSLRQRALRHLDRLIAKDQGLATADLIEWRQVLQTYSDERLGEFLASESSRAQRLRQSSPFFAVLNAGELNRLAEYLEGPSELRAT